MKIIRKIKIKLGLWSSLMKECGAHSIVARSALIYCPENLSVGSHCIINEGVMLNARASINIGDYVHISPYCIINTGGLDYKRTMAERVHIEKPVVIKDGVWVGSGAIINPGVTIGKNAVIGAGAVVASDIPEDSVAVGVPARVVKKITD